MPVDDKSRFGLTETVLDVTIDVGDEMEERFVVRFTGRADNTLHFTVRRTIKDVRKPEKGTYGISAPSFRQGIAGTMGQQWDCHVPVGENNVAVAHWVFGEGEYDRFLDHYVVAENGDLVLVDPGTVQPQSTERRMGFRPQYD